MDAPPDCIVELRNVSMRYGEHAALEDFSLTVRQGEFLTLLGPSGSGKTTLLRLVAGFELPQEGQVRIEGHDASTLPPYRRNVNTVFQHFALFPHLTVFRNVAFGLEQKKLAAEAIRSRVRAILGMVELPGKEDRYPHQLSGGEKQRVALARALVLEPAVLLLDEPLGALDANLRERMMIELRRIHRQLGIGFLHVTGNEQEALAMGDRVSVLDGGRLAQLADPDTIYNRPASADVARFLNCYNIFEGRVESGRFEGGSFALPCPTGAPARAEAAKYCIRFDRIRIAADAAAAKAGEAAFRARYLASEYDGPTITYFFASPGAGALEVEYHLSLNRPEEFEVNRDYALLWSVEDALVYA